jgi:UDP-3-O-[3-hydroxymyristoyl] glucosamine N-acyltransferase
VDERFALAVCEQPRMAFARLHNLLAARGFYWDDFETEVHPEARVHPRAFVAPRNVRIGARTVVEPNATVLERCLLSEDVHVGAGAVLGAQGFQTARTGTRLLEMDHAGGLEVRPGVRIFSGAVVATGLFRENTVLGIDARIGSQAFVSHGAKVGARTFVGHGAVVNGGVRIGDEAWIGPGATLAQRLEVGERAVVSLGAVVIGDVADGERVSGNFAIPHRKLLRHLAAVES